MILVHGSRGGKPYSTGFLVICRRTNEQIVRNWVVEVATYADFAVHQAEPNARSCSHRCSAFQLLQRPLHMLAHNF